MPGDGVPDEIPSNAGAQVIHVDKDVAVKVLVFEDRSEAFGDGEVVASSSSSDGANDLEVLETLLDLAVAELTVLVSV